MKNLKRLTGLAVALTVLSLCSAARAAIDVSFANNGGGSYSANWSGSQDIPDNTDSGLAFNLTFGDASLQISSVTVSLTISGGWNGDLYGYLSHGDGFIVLLNRVGSGDYGNPGFVITLTDGGTADFGNYQDHSPSYDGNGRLTGNWQAQGGLPGSVSFDAAFDSADPNGTWTLFFADKSALDISSIVDWTVDLSVVPEPTTWAAIIFGTAFAGVQIARRVQKRKVA